MDARQLTEIELARHLDGFAAQLGLRRIARELKIGAYRLDAVAQDATGLVVIELKANASITALSQLLLYPHALAKALRHSGVEPPPIRSVLITTHLNLDLVEVVQALSACRPIEAWVCVGSVATGLTLVKPHEAGKTQAWHQSGESPLRLEDLLRSMANVRASVTDPPTLNRVSEPS